MRILLTGVNGQVGYELSRTLQTLGEVVAVDHAQMDLASKDAIKKMVAEVQPQLIVNPAAYTAVDKAESEPELAQAINGDAPGVLAEEAKRIGAALIHFSTDYVFNGSQQTPYSENDQPSPTSVYGRTKLAGEAAIAAVGGRHLILRTSWVYGMRGANFLLTMMRLARQREDLSVVDDQLGSPTWCRMLAEVTAQLVAGEVMAGKAEAMFDERNGIYHVTSTGTTSWYGFAKTLLELDPQRDEQILKNLKPIPSSDYPTPAKRPAYSMLATDKLARDFGLQTPDWQRSLRLAMGVSAQ